MERNPWLPRWAVPVFGRGLFVSPPGFDPKLPDRAVEASGATARFVMMLRNGTSLRKALSPACFALHKRAYRYLAVKFQ